MSDKKRQLARLEQLGALQELRQNATSIRLASAQKESAKAQEALKVAQGEEAATRSRLSALLDGDRFDCGAYALQLDFLEADTSHAQTKGDLVKGAQETERNARYEYFRIDAGNENLQRAINKQKKAIRRKDDDNSAAQHLDQYISRHEVSAK